MIRYRLLTRYPIPHEPVDKILAHEGWMPPFINAPEVVIWGQRVFRFHDQLTINQPPELMREYLEAFFWTVVE